MPNITGMIKSRRMRLAGDVARMGKKKNAQRIFLGKSEGKRPLGRSRSRWVDNIRIDLGEKGWGGLDWIGLVQDSDKRRNLVLFLSEAERIPAAWCGLKD
jgi:hypothetical protein